MLVLQPLKRRQLARPPCGTPVMISTRNAWSSCYGIHICLVQFHFSLERHPHDTYDLLEDEKFVYNLMKLAKVAIFVLLSNYKSNAG